MIRDRFDIRLKAAIWLHKLASKVDPRDVSEQYNDMEEDWNEPWGENPVA
jgi:hypothetical protein